MSIDGSEEGNVTREDFRKTLQVYAKAIELQILNSQQQEKILENQDRMISLLETIESHFSNGFRSELKEFIHEEVQAVVGELRKCVAEHDKGLQDHRKAVDDFMEDMSQKVDEMHSSIWRQAWLWGGIALFTVVNAIATIISLWANGVVIPSK